MNESQATQRIVQATADAYDDVPYTSMPFQQTQPSTLGAMAALFGLQPMPLEQARVLEIGCAGGGNLFPFASAYPGSFSVGADISGKQIADANATLAKTGLTNLRFFAGDVRELPADYGPFDYIIMHGVYSWVPPEVQDGLMQSIKNLLSERGIAYISYNTYPGWHCWELSRHLMWRASAHITDPRERTLAAMNALRTFAESSLNEPDRPIRQILQAQLKRIESAPWYYVLHEYLEPSNYPCYFRDFVANAARFGLRYMADTAFPTMFLENCRAPETEAFIRSTARHRYDEEELIDYVSGRTFRCSLLVHDFQAVDLNVRPDRLYPLQISGQLVAKDQPDAQGRVEYYRPESPDHRIKADEAFGQAVLALLVANGQRPMEVAEILLSVWTALGQNVAAKTDAEIQTGLHDLASFLLHLMKNNFVLAHYQPPRLARSVSEYPQAFALARFQAAQGQDWISNAMAGVLTPGPGALFLLPLLDGKHRREDLVAAMSAAARKGSLPDVKDGPGIAPYVDQLLAELARTAVLVQ